LPVGSGTLSSRHCLCRTDWYFVLLLYTTLIIRAEPERSEY
jgi:hypothetical protein